ncbi:hypothetical protein C6495_03670 [Candidatus Poribacteria bacterium]|nr:MAG: hypothetical protein C6495_03670 [Candidatus Poribacteria bacterium]
MFWQFIYNALAVPAMFVGFHAAGYYAPKIREGIRGRRDVFEQLKTQLRSARNLKHTAWFHFTSVGEFEQAKPLIEAIYAETRTVLTFFSPSVAPNVSRYPHADAAGYLPFDTPANAERLIQLIAPSVIVFSKFDIWPNLVWKAAERSVPIVVVAGTLHAKSKRLSPFAKPFFSRVHRHITLHCAISEEDAARFAQLCATGKHAPPKNQIVVTGDTRYEQVYRRATAIEPDATFFPGQATLKNPILIAGSTYSEEEAVVLEAYQLLQEQARSENAPVPHLILVPHEPTPERIAEIRAKLDEWGLTHVCFSALKTMTPLSHVNAIVVDTVGHLAKLYRLADIAFVGGSFHGSVHNVMEPAAMAKPVLFGPTIHNAYEASLLLERGAAKMVQTAVQLADAIAEWLSDEESRTAAGERGKLVIEENLGAVERTLVHLREYV